MELHIEDLKKLNDVKREFSERYPFLKLEFFNHSHSEGKGSPKSDMIVGDLTFGEIRQIHNEGDITIKSDMPVNSVEQEFENKYGIHAQIFRKSGDLWLETSATDSWTLKEQNETGALMG